MDEQEVQAMSDLGEELIEVLDDEDPDAEQALELAKAIKATADSMLEELEEDADGDEDDSDGDDDDPDDEDDSDADDEGEEWELHYVAE